MSAHYVGRVGSWSARALETPASVLALLMAATICAPALAQTPPAAEEGADDTIIVTGRAQKLYRATETTVGKVPGSPLDIPQSVQVITSQLIEDQGARDVTDLYRNVAGVSVFSYSGVTFRGFRQDTAFYDGLRGNPFVGFAVPQLFNIDRVEFLKGPAGMLYGPGSPGGTINYVTKKPTDSFVAHVRGTLGNFDRVGVAGDVSGPIVEGVNGRAGLFYEDLDSFRVNAAQKTLIADGGLTFAIADGTSLTTQVTHYDQDQPGNRLRGVPVDINGNFLASIRWNHNEPTDYLNLKATVYQARLDSQLSQAVSFNLAGRWFEYTEKQQYHEPQGLIDTNGDGVLDTTRREFRDQFRNNTGLSFAGNLIAKGDIAGTAHALLAGADWSEEDSGFKGRTVPRTRVPNLSILNPVYGLTSGAAYNLNAIPLTITKVRATRYGVYVQDQVTIADRFILLAGLRKDWFDDRNLIGAGQFKDSALTKRFGAIYKPRSDISIYASWSDTFEPQATTSQDAAVGGPFAPLTGDQIEAGIKTAILDGRLQANAAIYKIRRQNLLQVDTSLPPLNGRDQLAPIGEVTSKGFEVDFAADLTPDWVLTGNYAYNDTKVTGTAPGQAIANAVGNRFANAPQHKLGFWTRYQVKSIDTAFAFGGQYVATQIGPDRERVKPFTIFDGSIIKTLGFAEIMLRVENIFDKRYATSGFGLRNGSFPGDPRTVFVELRKTF